MCAPGSGWHHFSPGAALERRTINSGCSTWQAGIGLPPIISIKAATVASTSSRTGWRAEVFIKKGRSR